LNPGLNSRNSKIYDSHISNEPSALIREDSSKRVFIKPSVFYYDSYPLIDTAEFVLYDFNLSLNDTVTVFLKSLENNYFRFLPYELFVENIDSVWSATGFRKRFRMLPVTGSIWGSCDGENYWIEGIGSTVAPLYTYLGEGSCFENSHALHNFIIGNEFIYGENTDCNLVYSLDEKKNDPEILKIVPNPVVNISTVIWKSNNASLADYEIKDLIGRRMISKTFTRGHLQINIARNEFPPGIYILSVTDLNGEKVYSKFLIQ
jgi:hypothetical protein